jgi:translation initiation factor 1A
MPANIKGGKQYKKKAKVADTSAITIERQPDQQIARVLKPLGNRFMSCYCNDAKIRVCRVRGKLRGRDFVEKGDVVLISLRTFETDGDDMTGDILAKYPHESLSSLKKEEGINTKLFAQLDLLDGTRLGELGDHEEAFEFEAKDDSEEELSDAEVDKI